MALFDGTCEKCLLYEIKLRKALKFQTAEQLENRINDLLVPNTFKIKLEVKDDVFDYLESQDRYRYFVQPHFNETPDIIDAFQHHGAHRFEVLHSPEYLESYFDDFVTTNDFWKDGIWQNNDDIVDSDISNIRDQAWIDMILL